ncbi:MAG: AAA family ATPase [Desulfobacterales bacterium]|nr:AAA family ATPase [Desulfobacterales bacterium]
MTAFPATRTMANVICIVSQKGGTGKTTTAVNLAGALALFERRTLLIDCDPLGNATTGLGIEKQTLSADLADVLTGKAPLEEAVVDTELPDLRLLPGRFSLMEVEKALSLSADRQRRLRKRVEAIAEDYEYILLDAPPSLNFLAVSAMICADWLLIPVQCQIYTLEGMGQLLAIAGSLQQEHNPGLSVAGVLFTMCPDAAEGQITCPEEILGTFRKNLFHTTIPWDGQLRESSDFGRPLVLHDITARGARAYLKLAMELVHFFEQETRSFGEPSPNNEESIGAGAP